MPVLCVGWLGESKNSCDGVERCMFYFFNPLVLQAAAQADAVKGGGGVVYFPPGTYSFANNSALSCLRG